MSTDAINILQQHIASFDIDFIQDCLKENDRNEKPVLKMVQYIVNSPYSFVLIVQNQPNMGGYYIHLIDTSRFRRRKSYFLYY